MHLKALRNRVLVLGAALVLLAAGFQAGRSSASGAEPGSAADPLVSKSYVDQYVAQQVQAALQGQINQYIQTTVSQAVQLAVPGQVAQAVPAAVQSAVGPYVEWQVVTVPQGQGLVAGAGTEMVLRAGQAKVVASAAGGLADLTAGKDLAQGAAVPANHLLLAAKGDGRGLTASTSLVVLVRGSFSYTGQ